MPIASPAAGLQAPADGGMVEGGIALPAGAKVVSQSLSGDHVSLYVEEPAGLRSIYIYDVAAGRMIGHFAIKDRN